MLSSVCVFLSGCWWQRSMEEFVVTSTLKDWGSFQTCFWTHPVKVQSMLVSLISALDLPHYFLTHREWPVNGWTLRDTENHKWRLKANWHTLDCCFHGSLLYLGKAGHFSFPEGLVSALCPNGFGVLVIVFIIVMCKLPAKEYFVDVGAGFVYVKKCFHCQHYTCYIFVINVF